MPKIFRILCLLLMGRLTNPFVSYFDMGGGDAPAPDPNIGIAAANNSAISAEALAFNKQMYEESKPRQAASDAIAAKVVEDQLAISKQSQLQASDQWETYKKTFQPVETQMAADAMNYDSAGELNRASGEAAAGVQSQYDNATAQQRRQQASMGVNPNSGRALTLDSENALGLAGSKASAANGARIAAHDKGIALRAGASNLGRGLNNTVSTAFTAAVGSGNSAVNNQNTGLATANASGALMNQGYGVGISGNNSAGSILNNQYQSQLDSWAKSNQADATGMAGIGSMIGQIGSNIKWSSKKLKENKTPISDDDTLDKVKKLPVEAWKYKAGVADEGEHIGPYAEDTQKAFGDKAAPGGKMIDMISMMGINMSATKGLAKQVDKLSKTVNKIAATRGVKGATR